MERELLEPIGFTPSDTSLSISRLKQLFTTFLILQRCLTDGCKCNKGKRSRYGRRAANLFFVYLLSLALLNSAGIACGRSAGFNMSKRFFLSEFPVDNVRNYKDSLERMFEFLMQVRRKGEGRERVKRGGEEVRIHLRCLFRLHL